MTVKRESDSSSRTEAKAAATREAKGSVHEAIGKLIGDDAARQHGAAEKQAGAWEADDIDPAPPA